MAAGQCHECSSSLRREAVPPSGWHEPVSNLDGAKVGLALESDAADRLPVNGSGDPVVAEGALVAVCGRGPEERGDADDVPAEREVLRPGVLWPALARDDSFGFGESVGCRSRRSVCKAVTGAR